MGKALGGGTSINGMVWARGHKNDFDHWAKEAGDDAWGYAHVLDIYRRIEDWHGAPDPLGVFAQTPSNTEDRQNVRHLPEPSSTIKPERM